jgi:hypothetical protein
LQANEHQEKAIWDQTQVAFGNSGMNCYLAFAFAHHAFLAAAIAALAWGDMVYFFPGFL